MFVPIDLIRKWFLGETNLWWPMERSSSRPSRYRHEPLTSWAHESMITSVTLFLKCTSGYHIVRSMRKIISYRLSARRRQRYSPAQQHITSTLHESPQVANGKFIFIFSRERTNGGGGCAICWAIYLFVWATKTNVTVKENNYLEVDQVDSWYVLKALQIDTCARHISSMHKIREKPYEDNNIKAKLKPWAIYFDRNRTEKLKMSKTKF